MRYSFFVSGIRSCRRYVSVCSPGMQQRAAVLQHRRRLVAKSYARRRSACTFAIRTSRSKGLAIKSSAPMFIAITMFMLSAAEERNRIGTFDTLANFAAPVVAVKKRQRNIQQDDVRLHGGERRHYVVQILRLRDLQVPRPRRAADRLGNAGVVLNDECTVHKIPPLLTPIL